MMQELLSGLKVNFCFLDMFKKLACLMAFQVLCGNVNAQGTISDAVCRTHESIMQTVFVYRSQEIPIGTAESLFGSEKDIGTRIFLKRVVRDVYSNPDGGKKYMESGKFHADCVKVHKGF